MSRNGGAGGKPEPDHSAEGTSGGSGEGADSALEAMLRKRQMRVNTEPDPAAAPTTQQQGQQRNGE